MYTFMWTRVNANMYTHAGWEVMYIHSLWVWTLGACHIFAWGWQQWAASAKGGKLFPIVVTRWTLKLNQRWLSMHCPYPLQTKKPRLPDSVCNNMRCVQAEETCLNTACEGGNLEIVQYLCEHGGKELLMLTNKVSNCMSIVCMALCMPVSKTSSW